MDDITRVQIKLAINANVTYCCGYVASCKSEYKRIDCGNGIVINRAVAEAQDVEWRQLDQPTVSSVKSMRQMQS